MSTESMKKCSVLHCKSSNGNINERGCSHSEAAIDKSSCDGSTLTPTRRESSARTEEQTVPSHSSTEMSCCVPECANLSPEWATAFPRDEKLMESWRAAIKAATGRCPSEEETLTGGALICNAHFDIQQHSGDSIHTFRMPSLFVRDNVQLRVQCCRLCMRFDSTENMFSEGGSPVQGHSLSKMFEKYCELLPSEEQSGVINFLCETCIVRINMTCTFLEHIKHKQAKREQEENIIQNCTVVVYKKTDQTNLLVDSTFQTEEHTVSSLPASEQSQLEVICRPKKRQHKNGLLVKVENKNKTQPHHLEDQPTSQHVCLPCEMVFRNKSLLQRHEKSAMHKKNRANKKQLVNRRGSNVKCNLCDLVFNRSKEIVMHFKEVHPKTMLEYFPCCICEEIFFTKSSEHYHSYFHTDVFKCSQCGKRCGSKYDLTRHSKIHDIVNVEENGDRSSVGSGEQTMVDKNVETFIQNCEIAATEDRFQEHDAVEQVENELFAAEQFLGPIEDIIVKEEPKLSEPCYESQLDPAEDVCFAKDLVEEVIVKEKPTLSEPCHESQLQRTRPKRRKKACLASDVAIKDSALLKRKKSTKHSNISSGKAVTCLTCKKSFAHRDSLKRHEMSVMHKWLTSSESPLAYRRGRNAAVCSVCNASFDNSKDIVIHFKKVHPKKKLTYFPCRNCDQIFFTALSKRYHSILHTDKFKCNQCGKRCGSTSNLKSHKKQHSKETVKVKNNYLTSRRGKLTICMVCNATFNHSKEIVGHFKELHPENRLKYYPCHHCEEVRFTLQSRSYHSNIHTDKFKCKQCGKRCESKAVLKVHEKRHDAEIVTNNHLACRRGKLTICLVCNTTLNHSKEIIDHFKELHPENKLKYYPCRSCEEVYFTKHAKMYHSNFHTDKYKCNQCGRCCGSKTHLISHKEKHNTETRMHQIEHKKKKTKKTSSDNRLAFHRGKLPTCIVCNASFNNSKDIVNHFKELHQEEELKSYPCLDCEEVFFDVKTKLIHSNTHTDKYKCTQCERRCGSKNDLENHKKKHNTEVNGRVKGKHPCLPCKMVFPFRFLLKRHEQTQNHKKLAPSEEHLAYRRGGTGGNAAVCNVCEEQFCPSKDIVQHFKDQHPEKKLKYLSCKECEEVFFMRSSMYTHSKRHTDIFKCDICGMRHTSSFALKRHKNLHQPPVKKIREKPVIPKMKGALLASRIGGHKNKSKCNVCHASFNHAKEVVTHFKEVHPETELLSYPCRFCEEVFFVRTTLFNHLNIHKGKHKCNECGQAHRSKAVLTAHIQIHHNQIHPQKKLVVQRSLLKCKVCRVSFNNSKEIAPHYKEAHPEVKLKSYSCRYCDKVFMVHRSYLYHENLHTDIYKCKQCGKRHGLENNLKVHLRKHLTKGKVLATRQGGLSRNTPLCNVCNASFEHSKEVVSHFKKDHPERKLLSFQCRYCEEVFFNRLSFMRHLNDHKKRHKCDQCGKRFGSKAYLKQHLKAKTCQVRNSAAEDSPSQKRRKDKAPNVTTGFKDQMWNLYPCSKCDEVFFVSAAFIQHDNTILTEKYKCDKCEKKHTSRGNLEMHRQSAHGIHHCAESIETPIQTVKDTLDDEESRLIHREPLQEAQTAEQLHTFKYLQEILDKAEQ